VSEAGAVRRRFENPGWPLGHWGFFMASSCDALLPVDKQSEVNSQGLSFVIFCPCTPIPAIRPDWPKMNA
jgi:hypothetical protein